MITSLHYYNSFCSWKIVCEYNFAHFVVLLFVTQIYHFFRISVQLCLINSYISWNCCYLSELSHQIMPYYVATMQPAKQHYLFWIPFVSVQSLNRIDISPANATNLPSINPHRAFSMELIFLYFKTKTIWITTAKSFLS